MFQHRDRPLHYLERRVRESIASHTRARIERSRLGITGSRARGTLSRNRAGPAGLRVQRRASRPGRCRVGTVPPVNYLGIVAALVQWSATERLDRLRSRVLIIAADQL